MFEGADHQQHQLFYQYSQCNGRKRALCVCDPSAPVTSMCSSNASRPQIGINYFGQSAELKGCINDARNVSQFLQGST